MLKRAYEPAEARDGYRILVDRLWPRGLSRERLKVDEWCQDLAPSSELRSWFGHDEKRWTEFVRRYRAELSLAEPGAVLERVANRAATGSVTLVYAASDETRNNAVVLRDAIRDVHARTAEAKQKGRDSARVRSHVRQPERQARPSV
jgi:uncharacterized protein YeaO (DUF488 family)